MSRDIDKLLQECLAGLDAGLTAEECLSAWPEQRCELEPMLRQAVMLRMAYAHAPSEEFRENARERLMFAAGREARKALAAEPDPRFVQRTRQHLLSAAGASAQESLRAVPPPRLAFWMNARRRLLQAAATHSVPSPASRPMALTFRSGLSAAVVVLAITVAGLAYFSTQPAKASVDTQLANIDKQLREVEQQTAAGKPPPADTVFDLVRKTNQVSEKINTETPPSLSIKASDLVQRQQEIVNQVATTSPEAAPAVQEAKQLLKQSETRIQAASAATPVSAVSVPTQPPSTPAPATTGTAPGTNPTSGPSSSSTAVPASPTPRPLGPNEIRLALLPSDTTFAPMGWSELRGERFRMVLPSSWPVVGPNFDATGIAKLETKTVRVDGPNGVVMNINPQTGDIQAIVDGALLHLRNADGTRMPVDELVEKAGSLAGVLNHMLESVVHTPATPAPTATPPATATPSRSTTVTP